MKNLMNWMKTHPIVVALFSAAFATIATCLAFRDDWTVAGCAIYGVLIVAMCVLIKRHSKAVITVLVAVALVSQPLSANLHADTSIPDREAGCGLVAAVVVVVIGGIVVYKLVKFCQKKFPKSAKKGDKGEGDGGGGSLADGDTEAAAMNFGEMGSCYLIDPCSEQIAESHLLDVHDGGGGGGGGGGVVRDTTTVTFDVAFDIDFEDEPQFVVSNWSTATGETNYQTFLEFQKEIRETYGVYVAGSTTTNSYAINGQPVESNRIHWDPVRRIPVVYEESRPAYLITVWRSHDMEHWEPILRTQQETKTGFRLEDASNGGQQYYKFSAELAD